MRLYDLLADCVEDRACLPTRKGMGPWQTKSGESVQRQVKACLRDGLMKAFYPVGADSCELTDKGRELGRLRLEARNKKPL
jgi:hypothetical protein